MAAGFDFSKKDKNKLSQELQDIMGGKEGEAVAKEKPAKAPKEVFVPEAAPKPPYKSITEVKQQMEQEREAGVDVLEAPAPPAYWPPLAKPTQKEEYVKQPTVKPTYVDKALKIEIRPIPNKDKIREFSEQLEHYAPGGHSIGVFVDSRTLRFKTGLSESDKLYLKQLGCPYDLSDVYTPGVPHPFWDHPLSKIVLKRRPMFLHPADNPLDFIKWKYLLVSDFIYATEGEMDEGGKPEATHFIFDESVETEIKATAIEIKNKLIRQVSELPIQRKRELILLVLNEGTDNKSESYLTMRFEEIFKNKPQTERLRELLNKSSKEITVSAIVRAALYKNVLVNRGNGIFFHDMNLGLSSEAVIEALQRQENQEVYIAIIEKIK